MKLCVIGTGYVGLVTGTCFAQTGNHVICVDIIESKINNLKKGILPIFEPGLKEILEDNVHSKRLEFTTDLDYGVKNSDIIFITVGTPSDSDGSADLKFVMRAASEIGRAMNDYKIIVDKSTVPVGTAEKVQAMIAQETDYEFDVVSNPEFLKEGYAIDDFMKPDRVIIGAESDRARETMERLYSPFTRTGAPILLMNIKSAELTKYAANSYLATKVTFMNEIANLCEKVGADVDDIRHGIGADRRIGPQFLFPGVGYGGSCFPKDVRALIKTSKEVGAPVTILETVDTANKNQKSILVDKFIDHFKGEIEGIHVAIWGLAFKPRTDDMREAPSIDIIERLLKGGAIIHAFDPKAYHTAKAIFGDRIDLIEDQYEVIRNADVLMLVTEWNEFREPDFALMKELMKTPIIFDGRNIWDPVEMNEMGFYYQCIGRPNGLYKH